jgi:hypothetical protein
MKKIITLMIVAILSFACKSTSGTNTPVTGTKLDKGSQVAIKGNWKITSVNYPGSDYI